MKPESIKLLDRYGEEVRVENLRYYPDSEGEPVLALKWPSGRIENKRVVDLIKELGSVKSQLHMQTSSIALNFDQLPISRNESLREIAVILKSLLTQSPYIEKASIPVAEYKNIIEHRIDFLVPRIEELRQIREKFRAGVFTYDELATGKKKLVSRETAKRECHKIWKKRNTRLADVAREYLNSHNIIGQPGYSVKLLENNVSQYDKKLRLKKDSPSRRKPPQRTR